VPAARRRERKPPRSVIRNEPANLSTTLVLAFAAWVVTTLWLAASREAYAAGRGTDRRIETPNGAIHVWTPARYEAESAGVVVYVHGYYTNVDDAWRKHRLARQFAESGINAVFIACEAPRGASDAVRWSDLGELLDAAATALGGALPRGRVVVVGHSGAHRTMTGWLDDQRIATIVLVDALYGEVPELRSWLDAEPDRRLIDAAVVTRHWGEQLLASVDDALVFDSFPPARKGKLAGARDARFVYVRSQHDHMELVTGGVAIPMLLRALRLPMVEDASREAPIRAH
jgi:hypothetical protein